jgi:hypothetical protein
VSSIHPERSCRLRITAVSGLLAAVAVTAGPAGVVSWPGAVLAAYLLVTVAVLVGLRRPRRPAARSGFRGIPAGGAGSRHGWR